MANPERPYNQPSSRTNDENFTDLDGKIVEMKIRVPQRRTDNGNEPRACSRNRPTVWTAAPLPQSFKCEKCGAAFADEGAAAVPFTIPDLEI